MPRTLLSFKGSLRKRILYTVGEVILIVVGILIAMSIDNWNEARKDREREREILTQLRKDYAANLEQLNEKIHLRELIIGACENVLHAIDDPRDQRADSVIKQLSQLLLDPTFDPIRDDVVESGNVRLIQHQDLRHLLTNWTSEVAEVQDIEKGWLKILAEQVIPCYVELGISRNAVHSFWTNTDWYLDKDARYAIKWTKSSATPSVDKILRSEKLEGLLAAAILYNYSGNIQSYTLRDRVNEILALVDGELKKR